MEEKKLFLLDAYALIYRAYFALIRAPRFTTRGFNTGAIFGFCTTLDEVLRKERPQYIAVCFDPPGGTFRHELFDQYKAQREATPQDIILSVPYIKRIIEAMRIPAVEVPGFEADDVIGTIARRAEAEGFVTYMMTPDKDYAQLVTPRILQYRPPLGGKGMEIRGPEQVREHFGVERPEQVIDLLALEGDKIDNIPGCPGIGEVKARKLIQAYGSVENMLAHAAEIKGADGRRVAEHAQQILFSKRLATIVTDVPVDISLDALRRQAPDTDELLKIYAELEFKSLIAKLRSQAVITGAETAPSAPAAPAMGSLFDVPALAEPEATPARPSVAVPPVRPRVLDTPAEAAAAVAEAISHPRAGVCLAAAGDEPMTATWQGLALACSGGPDYYIPLPSLPPGRADMLAALRPLFSGPACTVVSHDIKRDILLLRREGIDLAAPYYDTRLAHYLLRPEMRHTIELVAADVLGYDAMPSPESASRRPAALPGLESPQQACEQARLCLLMAPELEAALEREGHTALMRDIELPFARVLADMEWEGVRIDVDDLARLSVSLTHRLEALEAEAYELAGERFNIGSPMQVGEIIFGKMALDPKAKRTKSGAFSTTEEILEKHRRAHPIVDVILKVRALKKLLSTYVDALPRLINPRTGKIHTSFNQAVTATGRISSTSPNLQNIPIRTDDGREIRRAFIPDPGCLMLSADYSQIELRLMADFSADPDMVAAFLHGEDIHRATAAKIYHVPLDQVTPTQRAHAKTANFGIIYGISAFGLAERLDIPRSEAKALIDGYLATYPGVARYMERVVAEARDRQWVSTIKGRKRYLPDINSRNATVRGFAERNAINAPLQGSAADIIKIAMIRIAARIRALGLRSRMILQVHDELVFNVHPSELDTLRSLVVEEMEGAYSGRVPLEVNAGVGHNWLEAH